MRVVVVGQGYVGLPLAVRAVDVGHDVVGLEVDPRRAGDLHAGRSYVDDVTSTQLAAALSTGRYRPSTQPGDAAGFDVAVITVPTPLREGAPDLSFIEAAARQLAPLATPGSTVVLESTTYPGTTEQLLVPLLEAGSGLRAGGGPGEVRVGYSPERIDPGNARWTLVTTPKVVSGVDATSLAAVRAFYDTLVDTTVAAASPREAELAKLLENTFRHVNIALVNELAVFARAMGIDVWDAIDAASTKPFGFLRFTPGPGVGGHCLPIDPSYLSWQVKRELGHAFRFVELANDINDHMPDYVVARVTDLLNDTARAVRGAAVLLVGLAYKRGSGDVREAPSLRVVELLAARGAVLRAADPHVDPVRAPDGVELVVLDAAQVAAADVVVLLTDHEALDLALLETGTTPVLDTRGVLTGAAVTRL